MEYDFPSINFNFISKPHGRPSFPSLQARQKRNSLEWPRNVTFWDIISTSQIQCIPFHAPGSSRSAVAWPRNITDIFRKARRIYPAKYRRNFPNRSISILYMFSFGYPIMFCRMSSLLNFLYDSTGSMEWNPPHIWPFTPTWQREGLRRIDTYIPHPCLHAEVSGTFHHSQMGKKELKRQLQYTDTQ